MDTMEHATRKKVKEHPPALRQQVLSECSQPGASVAKVAHAHGLNANLVHAWRKQERDKVARHGAVAPPEAAEFIALPLVSAPAVSLPDIRVELRRGATTVSITWPSQAAGECAAWLKEWLR